MRDIDVRAGEERSDDATDSNAVSYSSLRSSPVRFLVRSLGDEEMSRIDVTHPELGSYVYLASGVGGMPGLMDEEHCPVSVVHDQTTYPFRFRNPFNAALTVDLILETDEEVAMNNAAVGLESPSADR